MKQFQRIFSLVLAFVLILGTVPVTVRAEETVPEVMPVESTETVTEPVEETTVPSAPETEPTEGTTAPIEAAGVHRGDRGNGGKYVMGGCICRCEFRYLW